VLLWSDFFVRSFPLVTLFCVGEIPSEVLNLKEKKQISPTFFEVLINFLLSEENLLLKKINQFLLHFVDEACWDSSSHVWHTIS